ncbi:glycosyltransferase [Chloroflexus aggregans]|uniref:Glycosyl transferase group 1 n=1 Tax=Chloroflexus aggregans (strain MD-66 / DSM 9485) TaxID=326427 RepID=B8GBP1_CHLAD|nr:glycosyltransferase [Chloroflexus aggregans]ACL24858.1 glycosyl transferase group 1 [Chloroflexus aggregans DSM 9485]
MHRRILILASWYPNATSPVGGVFIKEQAQILAEHFEVTVLAVQTTGLRATLRNHSYHGIERDGNLTIYRVYAPTLPYVPHLSLLSSAYFAWQGLRQYIHHHGRPDLIHAHVVLPCGWIAARAAQAWGVPAILTEHTSPFTVHLYTRLQRYLVRETIIHLPVLAISPSLRQRILEFVPTTDVRVLGEVIKTRFFTPSETDAEPTQSKKRFLTVALLTEQKGVDHLLQAAALLRQQIDCPFELVIGGDGPARPRLEQLARQFGLKDICRFVGLLNRTQVRDWMRWCDVFILPSIHETFGVVLGEAMACGKPVIATRCGGPEFVVEDGCGLLVPIADPYALADAMKQFLQDRVQYDPSLIRESVCQRFGEEAFLRNIETIYNEIWSKS